MTDQQDFCFWAQMRSAATSALRLAIRFKSDIPETPPKDRVWPSSRPSEFYRVARGRAYFSKSGPMPCSPAMIQ
jgi:hypothetical protein